MANAATLLAGLLSDWAVPANRTPESARGQHAPDWDLVLTATNYLREVDDHLAELKAQGREVGFYRAMLPKAKKAVLGFDPTWTTKVDSVRSMLSPAEIGLLLALGQVIDALPGAAAVSPTDREALAVHFEALLEEVRNATYLSADLRTYLETLLQQAAVAVRLDSTTDVAVRDLALRIAGAFVGVAEEPDVPDDRRGWWRAQATAISVGLVTSGVWETLSIGAGAVVKQITGSP